jgi:hypothetical protein
MSNATKWNHRTPEPNGGPSHREPGNGLLARTPNERTTYIEVQQYLDFKYGASSVDITLPNKTRAKLVVGADGGVYFQVPSSG